jgi:hypothetical protein
MIFSFSIGSKCAVMLPREFLNPQITPATGLVINRLVDSRSLVLVEEVWQFKGFVDSPQEEVCFQSGRIKSENWGWREIPEIVAEGDYIMLPAFPHNLMEPNSSVLEAMIKKSIRDFQQLNGYLQ